MVTRFILFAVGLSAASWALAGPAAPLPEPGSLALLGAGAVAAIAIAIRNRRK